MKQETPYMTLELLDGILIATYHENVRLNLPIARQVVADRLSFTGSRTLPVLLVSHGVISIDKAARDYLASPAGTAGLTASAVLVRSHFSNFLGNFFRIVNTPRHMPVRIFRNRQRALQWLYQYRTG